MKHIIIAAALLSATPAAASPLSDARQAIKICETTWMQSRREAALKRILDAGNALISDLRPGLPIGRRQQLDLQHITAMVDRCLALTYPDYKPQGGIPNGSLPNSDPDR